ncbi:hypothetical protein [Mesorhizobium sp. 1B3]|uniref:hypothetical protein n=1 Tax=Mesorhizobium sp. 1B3 TaxID=3243599 RepID=UPI003D9826AF
MRLLESLLFSIGMLSAGIAFAQGTVPEEISFEGGKFTITETRDLDKILAYEGREIARNYVIFYDRTVEVEGMQVALFAVGDGGNACGTATVIAWKPEEGGIRSDIVGEECGSPPAAVADSGIYFVPYLIPGASGVVEAWSPRDGVRVAGTLSFAPQPGTQWSDLDPAGFETITDAMHNEAVYAAAKTLLGDSLLGVMTGLQVGGGPAVTPSGIIYASGCVPHACGTSDAFMAVDPKGQKLYFAQERDQPEPAAWPEIGTWPADLRQAMRDGFDRPQ